MNVLAVFAHPDDEVLGCGGTLAKHSDDGDNVSIFLFVERNLVSEAYHATKILTGAKMNVVRFYPGPDQRLREENFNDLVNKIDPNVRPYDPDVIYTHHPGDLNEDHRVVAQAVLTAFRPKPGEKPRTILACEVLSSTEYTFPQQFQPNWFEALTDQQLEKKVQALECYPSEVQPSPHPRRPDGVMNHAFYRGQQCGVGAAEAFQLLRRGPC